MPIDDETVDLGGPIDPQEADTQLLPPPTAAVRQLPKCREEIDELNKEARWWEASLTADEGMFFLNQCQPHEREHLRFPYRTFFALTIVRQVALEARLLMMQGVREPEKREELFRRAWEDMKPFVPVITGLPTAEVQKCSDNSAMLVARLEQWWRQMKAAAKGDLDLSELEDD